MKVLLTIRNINPKPLTEYIYKVIINHCTELTKGRVYAHPSKGRTKVYLYRESYTNVWVESAVSFCKVPIKCFYERSRPVFRLENRP